MKKALWLACLAAVALLSCADDAGGPVEAGADAVTDTGAPDVQLPDVGSPVDTDDGGAPEDSGTADTGPDALPDAAAGADTEPGGDTDAGPMDAAVDTGPPTSCVFQGCDASNDTPCRKAKCLPETGTCIMSFEPTGKPCDDGDPNTTPDACQDGVCKGELTPCVCNLNGDCKAYDDGNLCNGTWKCVACKCVVDPSTIVACDTSSDDACKTTSCAPATGLCTTKPASAGASCDDGDPCTLADTCNSGICKGNLLPEACIQDANCAALDDGDLCNGVVTCQMNAQGCGLCAVDPGTVVTCDGAGLSECMKASCDPLTGGCLTVPVFNGAFCKVEGGSGVCSNGACVPKLPACVCDLGPGVCDDGDPCTTDSCSGCACHHEGLPGCCTTDAQCDDFNACTIDRCLGTCSNALVACLLTEPGCPTGTSLDPLCCDTVEQCDDGQADTSESCVDSLCHFEQKECTCAADGDCDDGDPCTTETCDGCVCVPATVAGCCNEDTDCDDGDGCTIDGCDQVTSTCTNTATGAPLCCGSSADCGGPQVCWQGSCAVKPNCSDGCDTATQCNDGDPTTSDTCATGPHGCGVCHHEK